MASEEMEARLIARCRALPLFDAGDYRDANPDLAQVEPYRHAGLHGVWEGRMLIRPARRWGAMAELCAGVAGPAPMDADLAARGLNAAAGLRVRVRLAPDAGPRSREAADRLAAALQAVGADVTPSDDRAPAVEIVVDPEPETDRAPGVADVKDRYGRVAVLLTRAPGADGFAAQLPRALASAAVIALAPETQAVFAAAGVPALWLEPPPPPTPPEVPEVWRAAVPPEVPPRWSDRPIEVAAFGLLTERRIGAWLDIADPLARRRTFVHMPRPRPPPRPPGLPGVAARDDAALRRAVFARSKVALHLHAAEPTALDWRTVCAGPLSHGAVLVAEPGLAHPRFDPDLHYFEEAPRRMPALVDWLLDTPEGRLEAQRRRLAARSALNQADDLFDAGLRVAAFLAAQGPALG